MTETVTIKVRRRFRSYHMRDAAIRTDNVSRTFYVATTDEPGAVTVKTYRLNETAVLAITDNWCQDSRGRWSMLRDDLYMLIRYNFIEYGS